MRVTAPVNVGDVFAGKYQVERVLGVGGMGVVVAARHLQLDERVAIKFLLPDALKDRAVVARFLREGRAAAKIRNEHVTRVYDVGTLANGAPYLVMEYLEGSDLDALLKRYGPLPVHVAAEYLLQACEAFADAHALGIVHRDIKPSNLFVTARSDGSPVLKIIDFGISKLSGADAGMDITKTVEMRGSPLFMSPEQIISTRNADARSDIWSLGITLYNLLTGSHPFPARVLTELCAQILQGDPAPLRATRPDVPAKLEAVILRCLQKKPDHRYANVAELAADIAEFAPPHARISAERAARVLRMPPASGHPSSPSWPQVDRRSSFGSIPDATGVVATPLPHPSSPHARPATAIAPPASTAAVQSQTVGSSWGSTRLVGARRTGKLVFIAGAAAMILVAGGVALTVVARWGERESPSLASPAPPPEPVVVPAAAVPAPSQDVREPSAPSGASSGQAGRDSEALAQAPANPSPTASAVARSKDKSAQPGARPAAPSRGSPSSLPSATVRQPPPTFEPPPSVAPKAAPASTSAPMMF